MKVDAEWTDDPKYHGGKCHYCDVELDDGNVFAEDTLLDRLYCMSCFDENLEEFEELQNGN